MIAHHFVGLPAEKMNSWPGHRPQGFLSLAGADDHELAFESIARLNGQIQPLVGSKSRNHEIIILSRNRSGAIEVRIHGRIDDDAASVIAFFDAALHGSTDGNEIIDAVGRLPIPAPQPFQEMLGCPSDDSMTLLAAKISGAHVPGVPHGRETVTDMNRAMRGSSC